VSEWRGWTLGETALFFSRKPGSDHVGLFIQYENDVHQVGVLLDEDVARETQAWLDAAITSTAVANAALADYIAELRADQIEEPRRG
jgi:hypothetical protein